jgi:hypothetical protein
MEAAQDRAATVMATGKRVLRQHGNRREARTPLPLPEMCWSGGGDGPDGQSTDFGLDVSPAAVTIQAGSSGQAAVIASPINGYYGSVSLSYSSVPVGVTVSLSPASVILDGFNNGISILNIGTTSAVTAPQTFVLTIIGTGVDGASGAIISHMTQLVVTILPATGVCGCIDCTNPDNDPANNPLPGDSVGMAHDTDTEQPQLDTAPDVTGYASNWSPAPASAWQYKAAISNSSGLVISDIRLGQRYMAKSMSVAHYTVQTTSMSAPVVGHLTSNLLVKPPFYSAPGTSPRYAIANYQDKSNNYGCLFIEQRYVFYPEQKFMEPSSQIFWYEHGPPNHTSPFVPMVSYKYLSAGGDSIVKFSALQRIQFVPNNKPNKIGGTHYKLFEDCDDGFQAFYHLGGIRNDEEVQKPLYYSPIAHGTALIDNAWPWTNTPGIWDNLHISYGTEINGPSSTPPGPGCPECVHMHWRWTALTQGRPTPGGQTSLPFTWGGGGARIPSGSLQYVNIGISNQEPNDMDISTTLNQYIAAQGSQPLIGNPIFWYEGVGVQNSDSFFAHGAWFSIHGGTVNLQPELTKFGAHSLVMTAITLPTNLDPGYGDQVHIHGIRMTAKVSSGFTISNVRFDVNGLGSLTPSVTGSSQKGWTISGSFDSTGFDHLGALVFDCVPLSNTSANAIVVATVTSDDTQLNPQANTQAFQVSVAQ